MFFKTNTPGPLRSTSYHSSCKSSSLNSRHELSYTGIFFSILLACLYRAASVVESHNAASREIEVNASAAGNSRDSIAHLFEGPLEELSTASGAMLLLKKHRSDADPRLDNHIRNTMMIVYLVGSHENLFDHPPQYSQTERQQWRFSGRHGVEEFVGSRITAACSASYDLHSNC